MTETELYDILAIDESYRIERTITLRNVDKLQEAICAFSNDLPGHGAKGYLLIGVEDDGKIGGLKVTDDMMVNISALRSNGNILPLPVMDTEKVTTPAGDVIVVTVTPSFTTPVRYRGRVFVRIGPRKDIASAEEERILTERSASHLATFDLQPCREATLDDLDIDTILDKYIPATIDREGREGDSRDIKEQLASISLYNRRFDCPTMAAIILFGKNPKALLPGNYIQYVRFSGTTKAGDIINEREFKGPLHALLPRLESFVGDAVVNQRPVPVSIFRERTVTNYPYEALRELLMNACMHRDYQSTTPIRLYQFDDRIEIMNPGGLYGNARPENFPHVNAYRNPIVAEAMKTLKYVNMFNRGVERVQGYLEANGSAPAKFTVDRLTVFEVLVKDANATDLERNSAELGTKIAKLTAKSQIRVKSLIVCMNTRECQRSELLKIWNLAEKKAKSEAKSEEEAKSRGELTERYFKSAVIDPAIELGLIQMAIPDKPNSPKQKYFLTELGIAYKESLNK